MLKQRKGLTRRSLLERTGAVSLSSALAVLGACSRGERARAEAHTGAAPAKLPNLPAGTQGESSEAPKPAPLYSFSLESASAVRADVQANAGPK